MTLRTSLVVLSVAASVRMVAASPRPRRIPARVPPRQTVDLGPEAARQLGHPGARWTLFLQRAGGAYTIHLTDDARENRTTLLEGLAQANIPAFGYGDEAWSRILECVDSIFVPFDVYVTDEDPGGAPHMEAVVGGRPNDVGFRPGIRGIAPFTCEPVENAVVFVFAEEIGNDTRAICETIAEEVGHAFGSDHEMLCDDAMSHLEGCGPKAFRDEEAPCGEWRARWCWCGGNVQNSFGKIIRAAGPRVLAPPPREQGLPCAAPEDCTSGLCVAWEDESVCAETCDFSSPADGCAEGYACREIGCGEGACIWGSLGIRPDGAPCVEDDECAGGLCHSARCSRACDPSAGCETGECERTGPSCGVCTGADPPAPLGASCADGSDCETGICVGVGTDRLFCATPCDDGACPQGYLCEGGVCHLEGNGTLGAPCGSDDDCLSGLCAAEGYCTVHCFRLWRESTCPEGFFCDTFVAEDICAPVPHQLPFGGDCGGNGDCASRECAGGRCTRFCGESAPCPPGWACEGSLCIAPEKGCGCRTEGTTGHARGAVVLLLLLSPLLPGRPTRCKRDRRR